MSAMKQKKRRLYKRRGRWRPGGVQCTEHAALLDSLPEEEVEEALHEIQQSAQQTAARFVFDQRYPRGA